MGRDCHAAVGLPKHQRRRARSRFHRKWLGVPVALHCDGAGMHLDHPNTVARALADSLVHKPYRDPSYPHQMSCLLIAAGRTQLELVVPLTGENESD